MDTTHTRHLPGSDYAQPHAALAGRRVLVTGGRGTLGAALCAGFRSLGCEVWAIDRSPLGSGTEVPGVQQRVADVRERATLQAVLSAMGRQPAVRQHRQART